MACFLFYSLCCCAEELLTKGHSTSNIEISLLKRLKFSNLANLPLPPPFVSMRVVYMKLARMGCTIVLLIRAND